MLRILPLHEIYPYVSDFLTYAYDHPELHFTVVAVGCGLAGYTPEQMAELFIDGTALPNITMPPEFVAVWQAEAAEIDADRRCEEWLM